MTLPEPPLREALARAAGWLAAQPGLPILEARAATGATIRCSDLPYAAAAAAWLTRRTAALAPPDSRVATWLKDACDPDGWVRFFGPAHPDLIGPDLDDTALTWSERRALTGDEPPTALHAAVLAARRSSGAFDTWPSPPEDGPPSEIDAVAHTNVVAYLAALGHREPDAWLAAHLADNPVAEGRRAAGTPYYPDPAALPVFLRRAVDLGATHRAATPKNLDIHTLLGACALAVPGQPSAALAARALLSLQAPDGAFPWAPVFVGGPRTGFPGGATLARPSFGGPVLSTALAVDALARMLGLPLPAAPPARPAPAPMPDTAASWPLLAGPLDVQHTLVARELASALRPFLVGPAGELPLDLGPTEAGQPAFCAAGPWSVSYRGPRAPDAAEARALRALAHRLAERLPQGPPPPAARPPSAPPEPAMPSVFADLASRFEAAPVASGPIRVHLEPDATAAPAAPALAAALSTARRRRLTLELSGLAHCALPSDEAWLVSSQPVRPPAAACHRCVRAPVCPGPGPHRLRPRTSDTPWFPLDRLATAWRAHFATPPAALWPAFAAALHDLGRGPDLGDTLWSPTLAVDVTAGRLDPSWRLAAFYGRRDGTRAPGAALLHALPALAATAQSAATPFTTDAHGLRDALTPAAARLPAYPGLQVDPTPTGASAALSVYLDTDHLPAAEAWAAAQSVAIRLGLTLASPPAAPRLLGLSAHLDARGAATLDLYARLDLRSPAAWSPPPDSPAAGHLDAIATLRVTADAPPAVRKWDLPFWPQAVDDDAVIAALQLTDPSGATTLKALLAAPEFTLHPTTLGTRLDGRRLYLRVC
ncbi:MAG: hypothetical protein R3F39_13125 [Myxococcota bacterium]